MHRSILAVAVLALAAQAARAQEPILLRISGTPGQANHYRMVNEMYIRGGPMAAMITDSTQPFTRMTIFTTRTLTGMSGDTLNFQEVLDSAVAESPAMPQMGAMMAGMVQQMRGQTTTSKMSPRGRVYSMETTGGPMAGGMGGPGGPGMGGPGRGPGGPGGRGGMMGGGARNRTPPPIMLPAQAVRPGDTWTDSATVGEPDQAMTVRATFKLDRVENRGGASVAVITWTGTTSMTTPQGPQQMNAVGDFSVDLTNKRLGGMNMTMTGTIQTAQGEMPVKMQMSSTAM